MIAITISGVERAPEWETLQTMLRQAMNDTTLLLTRVARRDNGCDYRAKGEYDLTARANVRNRPSDGEVVQIHLKVDTHSEVVPNTKEPSMEMSRQDRQVRQNIRNGYLTSSVDELHAALVMHQNSTVCVAALKEMIAECEKAGVDNFGKVPM